MEKNRLLKPTGYVLFALSVCMLSLRCLIFLILQIKTGLSVSLPFLPREYVLASMSVLASVSHILRLTLLTSPLADMCHRCCVVSFSLVRLWPQTMWCGTQRGMQIRQKSQCRVAPVCQQQRSAALHTAESASHSSHFYHDLEGYYIACRKKNYPCDVHCISSRGALCEDWRHVS